MMRWFKRRQKNRRLGRDHVLDVKVRASKLRAARARIMAISLSACFAVVLTGYLGWRGFDLVREWVESNPAYAIHEIDVRTDGVIAAEQLKRWSGVKIGQSLLGLDLEEVRRNLELVPVIKAVSIERMQPHTLCIRVVEREPAAQVLLPRRRSGGGVELVTFLIDEQGYVMLPLDPSQRAGHTSCPTDQLPVISGLDPSELQPGRRIQTPPMSAALGLIAAFERSQMTGFAELSRIDVSGSDTLQVTTSQGSQITFGLSDPARQLARWHEILQAAAKAGKAIATLDLAITNHIPARWVDASASTPVPAKTPKPPNNRKKHV